MNKIIFIFCLLFLSLSFSMNKKNIQLNQIANNILQIENIIDFLNSKDSIKLKNDFVQSILKKDKLSDEISNILSEYFLSQYIKPEDKNIAEMLGSSHKIMNLCFKIKNSTDKKLVLDLKNEFLIFKKLFKQKNIDDYQYKPYRYRQYKLEN